MARVYSNTAAQTRLTSAIDAAVTTIPVQDTTGWPTPTGSDVALAAIDYGDPTKVEIVTYTGKTGASLTGATRGQDGTTARTHNPSARVWHVGSAVDIQKAARSIGSGDGAGGVLSGTFPNPGFAVDMATQAELNTHEADTSSVHGVPDTAQLPLKNATNTFTLEQKMLRATVKESPINVRHPDFGGVNAAGGGDNTTTFRNAIAALPTKLGDSSRKKGKLFVPFGTHVITGTLTFLGLDGAEVEFEKGTVISWQGNATDCLYRLQGCRDSTFKNLFADSNNSTPLLDAVRIESKTGYVSSRNTFEDAIFDGGSGGLTNGFRTLVGDAGDANNDLMIFRNCSVRNHIGDTFSFEHSQSKENHLFSCGWNCWDNTSLPSTPSGSNSSGIRVTGGGFHAHECMGGVAGDADYILQSPNDTCLISGGDYEGSNRFLRTGGPSLGAYPITVQNVRWDNFGGPPNLNADSRIIINQLGGALTLINNLFGGQFVAAKIYNNSSGESGMLVAIGNFIYTTLANPWEGQSPTLAVANKKLDSGGQVDLPDIIGAARSEAVPDGSTGVYVNRNVGGTITAQRVSMGAADSGGAGFKTLRVPN